MLTEIGIRKLTAGSHGDRDGLSLRIGKSGTGMFRFTYRSPGDGKIKRIAIGNYLPANQRADHNIGEGFTLAEARKEALRLRELVKAGIDPAETVKAEKAAAEAARLAETQAPTLAELADEWMQHELADTPSGAERMRQLRKDVLPVLGEVKAKDLTARQVVLALDKVRARGAVALANRLHGSLSRMLSFAVERGILEHNPIARLRKKPEPTKDRVLSESEVGAFWHAIGSCGLEPSTVIALRLILLLGCRPGEIAEAPKAEFDLAAGNWWIPAERMKARKPHEVSLPALARDLLAEAMSLSGDSAYLFPNARDNGTDRPMPVRSLSQALLRKHAADARPERPAPKNRRGLSRREASAGRLDLDKLTPHDLRRTARTHWARLGIDPLTCEALLAHALPLSGIAAVYDRHNRSREKAAALELWEREVRRLCDLPAPDNVVMLAARAGAAHA